MAKYKEMQYGKIDPKWIEDNFVAVGGKPNEEYSINLSQLRLSLSKEEKERIVEMWNKIDSGELKHD